TNPREQARLLENHGGFGASPVGVEELDGDFPVELRIPGAIDLAEGSAADELAELEPSPALEPGRPDGVGVVREVSMKLGDRGDDPELLDGVALRLRGRRFRGSPVDGAPLEDLERDVLERLVLILHGPSLSRVEPGRASSP